jgi:thioredoxin-related protein
MAFTICANAQDNTSNLFTNKEEAILNAQENETQILMVFAGSDWCRPCIQFKKEILLNGEFTTYANANLTVLYLDFPSKKKNQLSKDETIQNESLAEEFNKSGSFPKIILADKNLQNPKEISFKNQSVQAFISEL